MITRCGGVGMLGWPVGGADLGWDHSGRQRLGYEPVKELFGQVAVPVADELTRSGWLGSWRLMAIGGFEWDAPATEENVAEFGYAGADVGTSLGVSEGSGDHRQRVRLACPVVDAEIGGITGKGSGEQTLARRLYRRLEPDWLLTADRNFYNWADWCTAADSGAQQLWRVKADLRLPVLEFAPFAVGSMMAGRRAAAHAR